MTDRPPHDETLGDECQCFRCHIGGLQFKGVIRQTQQKRREVEQPPSHWGRTATVERPGGGQVRVLHPDGRPVRVREATTNLRGDIDRMQQRNKYLSDTTTTER